MLTSTQSADDPAVISFVALVSSPVKTFGSISPTMTESTFSLFSVNAYFTPPISFVPSATASVPNSTPEVFTTVMVSLKSAAYPARR